MARVIFGTKLREKDCFTRHGPGCTTRQAQEDQSEPPWVWRRFWAGVDPERPPVHCISQDQGGKQGLTEATAGGRVFLIHCTRHFIRNLFMFFFPVLF